MLDPFQLELLKQVAIGGLCVVLVGAAVAGVGSLAVIGINVFQIVRASIKDWRKNYVRRDKQ